MSVSQTLYLASRSPRRVQLLAQIGMPVEVLEVDVAEVPASDETAHAYVSRVARDKAMAGRRQLTGDDPAWVIAADTEVVVDGDVLGKPSDAADARDMLLRLADRCHEVISAVCLLGVDAEHTASSTTTVCFGPLDEGMIERYVASGEAFGKAGAYAIQGRAAGFVRDLSGSYSGVVGLPLYETTGVLRKAGFRL